jgi:hypothetical protein
VENIDDVLSASDRLEKFNINMSLTDKLKLELVPKESGSDTFKFIKGYDSRTLYVYINEVERFFNAKGLRVVKYDNESSHDEGNQTNDLEIVLNKRDNQIMSEFYSLVMAELNSFREEREYQVRTQGDSVVIYPTEEKAYIEII